MPEHQIAQFLNHISKTLQREYGLSEEVAHTLTIKSPMRQILLQYTDYAYHMPSEHWAELIYEDNQ